MVGLHTVRGKTARAEILELNERTHLVDAVVTAPRCRAHRKRSAIEPHEIVNIERQKLLDRIAVMRFLLSACDEWRQPFGFDTDDPSVPA